MRQDDIHGDRTEFVLEVTNIKYYHGIIDVNVGLLRENTSKSTGGIFTQALSKLWSSAAHVEQGVIKIDDRWRGALMGERVASDTSASISIDEGLVEVGFFIGGEGRHNLAVRPNLVAAEHKTEQTVQSYKVGTQGVVSIFTIDYLRQIKGVDADVRVETETNVTTAHGVAKFLIFVFWVDNDDFGANHH